MNARIETRPSLGLALAGMWDQELERNALGAMMLGEPFPAWLRESDFFATQHALIFAAVQSVGGNVAKVNAYLREMSPPYKPQAAKSTELAEMCLEAEHARRMGWALDWPRLRELAKRRELLAAMRSVEIQLQADGLFDMKDARRELSRVFEKEAK